MAKSKAPYAGVYEKIDFPDYVYQEYPKMVLLKQNDAFGKPLTKIVNNHAEELRVIDEIVPVKNFDKIVEEKDELKAELQRIQDERDALLKRFTELDNQSRLEDKSNSKITVTASPTLKVPE